MADGSPIPFHASVSRLLRFAGAAPPVGAGAETLRTGTPVCGWKAGVTAGMARTWRRPATVAGRTAIAPGSTTLRTLSLAALTPERIVPPTNVGVADQAPLVALVRTAGTGLAARSACVAPPVAARAQALAGRAPPPLRAGPAAVAYRVACVRHA
jgi:hypothetical protein